MKIYLITTVFFLGCLVNSFSQTDSKVVHLDKKDFISKVYDYEKNPSQWIYEGSLPCIVDFYADWCGPCRKIAPILEELAKEYNGKIIVYKIDTDKQRELAKTFGIESIPTIMFIPLKGEPQVARGALPKETFENAINQILLK